VRVLLSQRLVAVPGGGQPPERVRWGLGERLRVQLVIKLACIHGKLELPRRKKDRCSDEPDDQRGERNPAQEADEIWSFVYSKARNVPEDRKDEFGVGDVWTWTALDADTKLIACWYVGGRAHEDADAFMTDLAGRLRNRIQLTTDGHGAYPNAVGLAFRHNIDFAQLIKQYTTDRSIGRYSPPICTGARVRVDRGDPDPVKISTSYVERQNLTMRMGMRRFTRLTNGFSKRLDDHMAAIALHFLHYNFARPHTTLADPYPRTPAMAAGTAGHVWSMTEIAALLD
jgi:IS1 family transposase